MRSLVTLLTCALLIGALGLSPSRSFAAPLYRSLPNLPVGGEGGGADLGLGRAIIGLTGAYAQRSSKRDGANNVANPTNDRTCGGVVALDLGLGL